MKIAIIRSTAFLALLCMSAMQVFSQAASPETQSSSSKWQKPPSEIMEVLHAPRLPYVSTSPSGDYLLLSDPVSYPPLAEMAAPMHKLAGMRINPANNSFHGMHGGTSPRLLKIEDGSVVPLEMPAEAEEITAIWTADGQRFAVLVSYPDRIELWTGSVTGDFKKIEGLNVNVLLGNAVSWLPDQERLLVYRIPERGPVPKPPSIPAGPEIVEGEGASARSTYEARNLLVTAYDDELFHYYTTSELVILDPGSGKMDVIGDAAPYTRASFSPDGKYLLVEYLTPPWSHEVAYWRFASETEVWDQEGNFVATIASLPVADAVPVHGERLGPRSITWRPTAPHTLFWMEALDGGDPMAEVPHRDRLMRLEAPFTQEAEEIYRAKHRAWMNGWGEEDGMLMLTQRERMKRWRYIYLLDVDKGTSRLWYDLDEDDRYGNPGYPLYRRLENGRSVLRQKGDAIYFRGSGATEQGDRPFLDLKDIKSGESTRLWRSDPDHYESFVAFAGEEDEFVMRSESSEDVPNYYLGSFGQKIKAEEGEATRKLKLKAITSFEDPTPSLRQIKKKIIKYEREDGVPLSFQLLLPPGYKEGTPMPTVLYAYPREYSGAATAGQIRGSIQRFMRIGGSSHLFFLLQGYVVLDQTTMPMVGDPETTYDTFVPQLVADAEAAVAKAVEMGVADPDRIGVIGHSHGGLMVANLLAHSDLFAAGIARSGSYNKTNQPFGFQSERRSLFDARKAYIDCSPTFFADKVDEPVLIIHGADDGNPGTLTFQSKVFYEAVRGSGGTARMVLLPYEDHGYRARESIEHVLWEQLRWFDMYVKGE